MLITGEPGIGKTLTTESTVRDLAADLNFKSINVNMLKLSRPHILFSALVHELTTLMLAPTKARLFLNDYFDSPDKVDMVKKYMEIYGEKRHPDRRIEDLTVVTRPIVLVLDEIDAFTIEKDGE